jgi:hypothetical protein
MQMEQAGPKVAAIWGKCNITLTQINGQVLVTEQKGDIHNPTIMCEISSRLWGTKAPLISVDPMPTTRSPRQYGYEEL